MHLLLCLAICFELSFVPFFQHEERAFVLKFAAMEIYNEVVRDLLSTDNTPLRLLDDPEVNACLFLHPVGL